MLPGLLIVSSIYTYFRAVPLRNLPEAFYWNGFDERRTKLKSKFAVKNIVVFSSTFQVTPGDYGYVCEMASDIHFGVQKYQ